MTEQDKIQSFGEMVEATERLTKPWKIAMLVTNIAWAFIVALLVWMAYMAPVEVEQTQDFSNQTQGQYYSEAADVTS